MEESCKLLPDRLKELWHSVLLKHLTSDEFSAEQTFLMDAYRRTWTRALLLEGASSLSDSLYAELGRYSGCTDLQTVRNLCTKALESVRKEWEDQQASGSSQAVEQFYDETQAMMYELMHWHTLAEDDSPLAYVLALRFAEQHGCTRCLDFGAGVGSGAILFARHGMEVTLADISSSMLQFSRWRMELRNLSARYVDLKTGQLPDDTFTMVSAMDVFEHLVDPVSTVDALWKAMKPGGILFGRFHAEQDADRPQHIVQDFEPTMKRLGELGFVEIWRDEWLWGHQAFRKP